jgi:hypothetical protein
MELMLLVELLLQSYRLSATTWENFQELTIRLQYRRRQSKHFLKYLRFEGASAAVVASGEAAAVWCSCCFWWSWLLVELLLQEGRLLLV